ncbi:MAG: cupin domain-containing protein [Candidatus Nomurabacteria bacterium]|nr:cupin domain-containing protein [Candidatus Nomurabacteria bacterium]USN87428.1 MAG: cupin domain-containing protein [Candidatus Nomurabacteria bacterium]
MELSERCIQTLEKEGFITIYEESEASGATHETHTHSYNVALFVTEGMLEVTINGETKELKAGDRANIPANAPHSTTAGPNGCQFVMGEKD